MRCPLITMSAVTGKPSRKNIYEYLLSLKNGGIEQVLVYPRSGCELEYLSEEWFDTVGCFIESAATLDMCIWLYDDFNWPSGDAGGRVTANPEYRLKSIGTEGESFGKISCKSRHNAGLFGEKFFPDLLSPEAVNYFIRCTHEEYYKRFGIYFGTVIKGIFTDEPSIGYCCQKGSIPHYDGLENDYHHLCGGDFYNDMRKGTDEFYLNAITAISNRFKRSYLDKLSSWCADHGVLMTGHMMCDDNPLYATKHGGRFLKNLSSFSLPGIDEIHTCFDHVCEMATLGAAEYASGTNGAVAELFALGPCDMSYSKKRAMLYFAACHKINHYFLAISHMDMRGNMLVKDYFNNFSADQPDFEGMRMLSEEAKRAAVLAGKDFTPDVYVRYPFVASAKRVTEEIYISPFFDLVNKLTYKQIQWKFIDDEVVDAPVIEFDRDFVPTLNGAPFHLSPISHKKYVLDQNSDTPSGIFVRKYTDGTLVVLNLFAPSGEYFVEGKPVYLNTHDVHLSNDKKPCTRTEEISPEFSVEHKNPNVARAMFLNEQELFEVNCKEEIKVTLAVRSGVTAHLNGTLLECTSAPNTLPKGMCSLYGCVEATLNRGVNVMKASNDIKYMPSVLIIGDFDSNAISATPCAVELCPSKKTYSCGERLYGYGAVEFTVKITIPSGAKGVELAGTSLFTRMYADGCLLGENAFAPYIFPVTPKLWGKDVTIKIAQHSSLAPIFGDVAFWDKEVKECGWRGTPSTTNIPFGFDKIRFVY